MNSNQRRKLKRKQLHYFKELKDLLLEIADKIESGEITQEEFVQQAKLFRELANE